MWTKSCCKNQKSIEKLLEGRRDLFTLFGARFSFALPERQLKKQLIQVTPNKIAFLFPTVVISYLLLSLKYTSWKMSSKFLTNKKQKNEPRRLRRRNSFNHDSDTANSNESQKSAAAVPRGLSKSVSSYSLKSTGALKFFTRQFTVSRMSKIIVLFCFL